VIARLDAFLTRPIADNRRRIAFGLAASVLAAAAWVPSLIDDEAGNARPGAEPGRRTAQPRVTDPRPATPSQPPTTTPAARPADTGDAVYFARRFLPLYVAYTYGRVDARAFRPFVDASLWRELAARPPHVPQSVREREPRLIHLRVMAAGTKAAQLEAVVDDGERRYLVPFVVARAAGRWQVVSVGS
jgi:hypothetical protein